MLILDQSQSLFARLTLRILKPEFFACIRLGVRSDASDRARLLTGRIGHQKSSSLHLQVDSNIFAKPIPIQPARMARYSDGSLGGVPRVIREFEGLVGPCFDSSHSQKVESGCHGDALFGKCHLSPSKYEKLRPKQFSVQGILFGVLLAVWDTPQNFNRTSPSTSFFSSLPSKLQNTLGVSIQKNRFFLSPLMGTLEWSTF